MKNKIYLKGGYIGILMILLAVCIIVFIIVNKNLISPKNDGKNMIEQGQDNINQAKSVVNLVEQKNIEVSE
jgi:uncharacterized membrane protein